MTKELFQKYIDGRCNPQERKRAEEWLHTCTPGEMDDVMVQLWNDKENPGMPAEQTSEMWKTLSATVMKQQPTAKVVGLFPGKKWAVAVAALAILAIGIIGSSQKKQATDALAWKAQPTIVDTTVVDWAHTINTGEKEKLVALQDGSEVLLFPKSTLTYRTRFGTDRRELFLDGKAIFQVAKDAQRPFTVYSGDIATTALGTRFLVDAISKNTSIHVQLYEGKIVVKTGKYALHSWKKQEFMQPGDELNYTIASQHTIVKQKHTVAQSSKELNFNNEQLYIVFDRMKKKYKVDIKYNKADLTGMYFTGSISQTSSLSNSLQVITQMNGLRLKEEHGKYIIQKTE
jgi:ferric-dicitrate binding protein FerR (iron transport regulator)